MAQEQALTGAQIRAALAALYVADKMKGRERKTLREYLEAEESRRFEAGLDLATLLSEAVTGEPGGI